MTEREYNRTNRNRILAEESVTLIKGDAETRLGGEKEHMLFYVGIGKYHMTGIPSPFYNFIQN